VTNRSIAHARLRNSRLVWPPLETPEDVVGWFGAVQSQDVPGALWGMAQRLAPGSTIAGLGAAMDDGRFVRTHGPRPTWHFLTPGDLRWILRLVGPRVDAQNGTMYRREGIAPDDLPRVIDILREALRGGVAMTRSELRAALAGGGLDVDGLRLGLLGMHAELEAVICNGPRRDRQATFVLVDEFVPAGPTEAPGGSLRELTFRYFRSHGPALAHDMAWWSGLTVGVVREGIVLAGSALEGRRIDGKEYWGAAGTFDPEPGVVPESFVCLLPNYDEYLGSYTDYAPIFDEALPRARTVADVLGTHLVVRDGLVVGGWRRTLGRDRVIVRATLLIQLTDDELDALNAAAAAFGRFVGLPVELQVVDAGRSGS
jgi:hypothetical protein